MLTYKVMNTCGPFASITKFSVVLPREPRGISVEPTSALAVLVGSTRKRDDRRS